MSMPIPPPAPTRWTQIRDRTVASLIGYGTLAADRVEADRVDPLAEGDGPRILVTSLATLEGRAAGGTAPKFMVSQTLMIVAVAYAATRDAIRATLDILEAQILEGLLGDPDWVRLANNPDSVKIGREYRQGAQIAGELHVHIGLGWKETYPPRLATPLRGVDLAIRPLPATPATPATRVEIDLAE